MILVKKASKNFPSGGSTTQALKSVSLNIKEGEFVAIMGPSGSGKSTLLNLISSIDTPSSGQVIYKRKNLHELNDKQRAQYRNKDVGFIFQEFHLKPSMNVVENILLPTYFDSNNKATKKDAIKLLEEVGLQDKIDSRVDELSGGQKQRVAIARALINKPKILIGDEPTGNLDTKTGKTIIDLLKKLHKTHKTTLIIATHDAQIAKSAKRIIKISDGKI